MTSLTHHQTDYVAGLFHPYSPSWYLLCTRRHSKPFGHSRRGCVVLQELQMQPNATTKGPGSRHADSRRGRMDKWISTKCLHNKVHQVKSVRLPYRQETCEPIGFSGSFDCLCFTVWEDVRAEAKWTKSQLPLFPDQTETKSLEPTVLIAVATGGVYLERCHTDIVFETHSSHAWLCLCSRASCMLSYHN